MLVKATSISNDRGDSQSYDEEVDGEHWGSQVMLSLFWVLLCPNVSIEAFKIF